MIYKPKTDIQDMMVKYINDKYTDDLFVYKRAFGGGAGHSVKTIVVSSQNFPDSDIYVRYTFKESAEYSDNYLSVKYAEQTESLIKSVLNGVLNSEYLLFYEPNRSACPNSTATMSFEEYVANYNSCIGFTVVVNGTVSNNEQFKQVLEKSVVDAGICCTATIYFDDGSDAYTSLDSRSLVSYTFKKLYKDVFSFEMNNSNEFSAWNWGDQT